MTENEYRDEAVRIRPRLMATVKGDRVSLLLTVDGQKSTRVYMLVYNRRTHRDGQVTIVVNLK